MLLCSVVVEMAVASERVLRCSSVAGRAVTGRHGSQPGRLYPRQHGWRGVALRVCKGLYAPCTGALRCYVPGTTPLWTENGVPERSPRRGPHGQRANPGRVRAVPLSRCPVVLSSCRPVVLSSCRPVVLSSCRPVVLSSVLNPLDVDLDVDLERSCAAGPDAAGRARSAATQKNPQKNPQKDRLSNVRSFEEITLRIKRLTSAAHLNGAAGRQKAQKTPFDFKGLLIKF